ncbi:MAG TPA: galactokinase [Vicinamibacterales bacterium]|nr:galactokinase [Vicinamibacterales bacterium]
MREVTASAPGRVNLIGEHTDYHQGFVLPTVLPQRTTVTLRPRKDSTVHVTSAAMPDGQQFIIGKETKRGGWVDYIQGVTTAATKRGFTLRGFDASITSTLPVGGGVSSSAALTVALLRAMRMSGMVTADDLQIAEIAQRAETDFVGAPIGIMDQMACSIGRPGEALFIDTRSLDYEHIPLPASLGLIVIDSGITHDHAGGQYGQRRNESFAAARMLGVQFLRDATELPSSIPPGSELIARRARHVITENLRVLEAVDALRDRDLARLGQLFRESHASQRDDYETSVPDIDTLVTIGERDPAVYGARMTGGGFGGSVVMLARAGETDAAASRILAAYQQKTARHGAVLVPCAEHKNQDQLKCG